jgi:hypothetical protein
MTKENPEKGELEERLKKIIEQNTPKTQKSRKSNSIINRRHFNKIAIGAGVILSLGLGGMCIADRAEKSSILEQRLLENYRVAFINNEDLCIKDINGPTRVLQKNILDSHSLKWHDTISYSKGFDRIFYIKHSSICSIKPNGLDNRVEFHGKNYCDIAVSGNGDMILKWYSGVLFTDQGVDFLRRGSKKTQSWSNKYKGGKKFQWVGDSLCYSQKGNIYMGDILLGDFNTDVFAVSPDKKYLAYGKGGLYVHEIATGRTTKLARGIIKNIAWSQDSQFITYAKQLGERYVYSDICITDKEGNYSKKIVSNSVCGRPIFIPQ